MIELRNVSKTYATKTKIGPLSLTFPKGGLTSIIGPNGAGKSTTLHMIGRLLGMDEGAIEIAGMDVVKSHSEDLAKIMTILRQENHFVTKLTVRQLVSFGRYHYSKGRLSAEDEKIISRYIDFFALKELENRYLEELSGGQRQRAYVAMVLTQDTDYILLDEPLNNLDVARSVDMMKLLRKVCDQFVKTIIAIMHDINFSAQYSNYMCCMKDGKIVAYGDIDEIMNGQLLTEIYETPIDIMLTPRGKYAIC